MKRFGLHPLLISLFPALNLLATNIGQVKPSVGLRSLTVSFLASILIIFLFQLVVHN